jgi:hypothetical protein
MLHQPVDYLVATVRDEPEQDLHDSILEAYVQPHLKRRSYMRMPRNLTEPVPPNTTSRVPSPEKLAAGPQPQADVPAKSGNSSSSWLGEIWGYVTRGSQAPPTPEAQGPTGERREERRSRRRRQREERREEKRRGDEARARANEALYQAKQRSDVNSAIPGTPLDTHLSRYAHGASDDAGPGMSTWQGL